MKAKLMFSDCWEDMEVQFYRETELEFVPIEGMQFMFEPDPFELFVDVVMWYHNEGLLVVGFDYPQHESKERFIESVKAIIGQGQWQYRANKKAAEIIDMILKKGAD